MNTKFQVILSIGVWVTAYPPPLWSLLTLTLDVHHLNLFYMNYWRWEHFWDSPEQSYVLFIPNWDWELASVSVCPCLCCITQYTCCSLNVIVLFQKTDMWQQELGLLCWEVHSGLHRTWWNGAHVSCQVRSVTIILDNSLWNMTIKINSISLVLKDIVKVACP